MSGSKEGFQNSLFGFSYSFIALTGGVYGLFISKKWGGHKSLIGRGILFLSLGLLGEWFGQTVWSYYNLVAKVETPYPSIGDIGYFSIIPFYTYAMICFARASGSKFSLKSLFRKLIILVVPLTMLYVSYVLFLKNLTFDLNNPIKSFLDYGYPIGEAIIISVALSTYTISMHYLGGKIRSRILFIIVAFIIQYLTDTIFLYRIADGTYYNGGPVDLMYALSFTVMSLGLISFSNYKS